MSVVMSSNQPRGALTATYSTCGHSCQTTITTDRMAGHRCITPQYQNHEQHLSPPNQENQIRYVLAICPQIPIICHEMSTSPTPAEREAADKEAKAREEAEQAALPYKWTQTIQDLDISVPVPGNLKGRDLDVRMARQTLRVGVKGQEPIIDVRSIFRTVHETW